METVATVPAGAVARPVPVWALLAALLAVGVLWAVMFESGQLMNALGVTNTFMHELFHDGRHLVGVPCH
jgi:hypothetical protein